jgi:hypothetical protein
MYAFHAFAGAFALNWNKGTHFQFPPQKGNEFQTPLVNDAQASTRLVAKPRGKRRSNGYPDRRYIENAGVIRYENVGLTALKMLFALNFERDIANPQGSFCKVEAMLVEQAKVLIKQRKRQTKQRVANGHCAEAKDLKEIFGRHRRAKEKR